MLYCWVHLIKVTFGTDARYGGDSLVSIVWMDSSSITVVGHMTRTMGTVGTVHNNPSCMSGSNYCKRDQRAATLRTSLSRAIGSSFIATARLDAPVTQ